MLVKWNFNNKVKMKRRIVKIVFVAVLAMVGGINAFNAQKSETLSDVGLANVEALASMEHGDIDKTLATYRRLSSYTYYIAFDGNILSTEIPCCMDDTSMYSGCAKGLDNCPG